MEKIISPTLNIILVVALTLALLVYYIFKIIPPGFTYLILVVVGTAGTIPVAISALKSLKNKKISIDLLASIALIIAILNREWASVAFINLMITSARIFGDYTETKAKMAIRGLLKLRPQTVRVKENGKLVEKKTEEVKLDDLVVIESGDRVPVDGVVVEGDASLDQSSLTGESIPVPKGKGDKVFSSTLNVSGSLVVKTQKIGKDTTFEKVVALVEEAQTNKIGIQTAAEKFTSWYILLTFVGTIILWGFSRNLSWVLSVLLVTCADDIAVAIPMAFWSSIGYAARHGIIIKGGNFLEGLAKIKTLVADKTGTITRGKISAEEVVSFGKYDKSDVLKFASIAESVSEHPIAKAIVALARSERVKSPTPNFFHEDPGKGIMAKYDGHIISAGSLRFQKEGKTEIGDEEMKQIIDYENRGFNIVLVARDKNLVGFIALADEPRADVKKTILKLREFGVKNIIMLTGDNERVAFKVAKETGITQFHANLLPEDKLKFVQGHLSQEGKLAMVGDGVNDAASLAVADVGIAMGTIGSDAAIESADVALMQDDFSKVAEAIALGRYTNKIAKENFLIWGSVNILGLALVFANIIGPQGAAAYNFVTDFFPILNSLRLFRYRLLPNFKIPGI